MAIVCGLDIHRSQVTFDWVDVDSGEGKRGKLAPANRETFRRWLEQFAGHDVDVVVETALVPDHFSSFSVADGDQDGWWHWILDGAEWEVKSINFSRGTIVNSVEGHWSKDSLHGDYKGLQQKDYRGTSWRDWTENLKYGMIGNLSVPYDYYVRNATHGEMDTS
jgi:hypothetical protein